MKDNIKKKKILVAVSMLIGVALLVFGIVYFVNIQTPNFPDVNEGPGEETKEKSLVFYDRDILTEAYNIDFSATVLDNITSVVFSEEEMKFSKENSSLEGDDDIYYDAFINAADLFSYNAYTTNFSLKISDEREYKIITRTNSLEENYAYIYTAITRDGGDKIFIYINGDDSNKNDFIGFVKEKLEKSLIEEVPVVLNDELPLSEE